MKAPMRCLAFILLAAAAPAWSGPSKSLMPDSPLREICERAAGPGGASNYVAIVSRGYDALLLRVHLIRNARRSIEIQTFIWTNDECGRLMMHELIAAARRGVAVRIVADHLVSDKDPDTVAFLATVHPNLRIKHYRPAGRRIRPSGMQTVITSLSSPRAMNQRMHNKLLVVDDAILITGGRNIENTYFDHSTEMNFKDRDVLAIGPVARTARASFDDYWNCRETLASGDLADVAAAIQRNAFRRFDREEDWNFGTFFGELRREADDPAEIRRRFSQRLHPVAHAELMADKPGKARGFLFWGQGSLTRELSALIADARQTVVIQSPYLVLSRNATALFRDLKSRRPGLRVVISSNSFGSTDNLLAYSANYRLRSLYIEELGLEVHEYKPAPGDLLTVFPQFAAMKALAEARVASKQQARLPFLCIHAKSLVLDDGAAFIGSFNLDPRSENLNTEVGLLIRDERVARELKEEILRDAAATNSWTIAKRAIPLQMDKVNHFVDDILGQIPVDVWPLQNTTSYELIPGRGEVPPNHPDFLRNYEPAGDFPGAAPGVSTKEILTRLYKAVGPLLAPMI